MTTKTYIAVADRLPDEARYSITFPGFSGVTSVADTLAEVLPQARNALATAVEDMEADGEALPAAVEDGAAEPMVPRDAHAPVLLLVPAEVRSRASHGRQPLGAVGERRPDGDRRRRGGRSLATHPPDRS